MQNLEKCLASQEIRDLIDRGTLNVPNYEESKIQPSSFEPSIGDEIFILDTEKGLFRPRKTQQIYRTLLELPKRKRQKINITGGFEVHKGHSYLIPLQEKLTPTPEIKYIISSPKSSTGRLFPNTRLLTDYNSSFDEAQNFPFPEKELGFWLLFQPLAFNHIIYPGLTLNQLRFFNGPGAKLPAIEVLKNWRKNPILFHTTPEGEMIPIENPVVTNSLQIHLDLKGTSTAGITALRARNNPIPIDLSKKEAYVAENYFEPLQSKDQKLTLEPGKHYLLASSEVLQIPGELNAELDAYSRTGLVGLLHRAGFVDNGFTGDLVFEVTSQEETNITLEDETPLGELNFFKTQLPDKLYGKEIGSHYQDQRGPKPPKFFMPFDYNYAARTYNKLSKIVLVEDARKLIEQRKHQRGFSRMDEKEAKELIKSIQEDPLFHSRYDCEDDNSLLQIMPYVLVFNNKNEIFSYVRAKDIKHYGEKRLFGKHSIGLGGHILQKDAPDFILNGLEREVHKEEVIITGEKSKPILLGTLFQPNEPVDKVHYGLVYSIFTTGEVKPNEQSIPFGEMKNVEEIIKDPKRSLYETWSRNLIPYLGELYEASKLK